MVPTREASHSGATRRQRSTIAATLIRYWDRGISSGVGDPRERRRRPLVDVTTLLHARRRSRDIDSCVVLRALTVHRVSTPHHGKSGSGEWHDPRSHNNATQPSIHPSANRVQCGAHGTHIAHAFGFGLCRRETRARVFFLSADAAWPSTVNSKTRARLITAGSCGR